MFKIGEKVKVKNHPDQVTGKVISRDYNTQAFGLFEYLFEVEFDDKSLIPPTLQYREEQLESLEYSTSKNEDNCQCGAKFTSYPNLHMLYCPKYSKP